MIDLTVKTLDSQNHTFSLNDDITVRQFKEYIADTVNIGVDLQRLIYCGRVLQDEKLLSEYDVNGKVIHLVQRAPPSSTQRSHNASQNQGQGHGGSGEWQSSPRVVYRHTQFHDDPMYIGSFSIPADVLEGYEWPTPQLSNTLANSHLTVVRRMLDQANSVIDRLDNPSAAPVSSSTSTESNSSSTLPDPTQPTSASATELRPAWEQIVDFPISTTESTDADPESTQLEPPPPSTPPQQQLDQEIEEQQQSDDAAPEHSASASNQAQLNEPSDTTSTNDALIPRELAELLDMLLTTQDRLRPYIRNRLLSNGAAAYRQLNHDENQRIIDGVTECFHFLSHAQHALSNLNINMQQPPPRTLRCRPMVIQPSAILQAGLPIQVEAHISLHGQGENNADSDDSTTNTSRSSTGSNQTTTTSASNETPPTTTINSQPQFPPQPVIPEAPRQTPRQQQSQTAFGTVFNFPNNVEVVMESAPQASRVWSFSTNGDSQGSGNNNNNNNVTNNNNGNVTSGPTAGVAGGVGFPFGGAPSPDIIRNLMQAVAGYMAQSGVAHTPPPTTTTTPVSNPSANSTPMACPRHPPRASSGESTPNSGQNSQTRGNTETHPTTSTQTRTTSRTHVFHQHAQALGVGVGLAHSLDFDPFLPCNSHHIRRTNTSSSSATPSASATATTTNIAASTQTGGQNNVSSTHTPTQGRTTVTSTHPRVATIRGVQIVDGPFENVSLADSIANFERISSSLQGGIPFIRVLSNHGVPLSTDGCPGTPEFVRLLFNVFGSLPVHWWCRLLRGNLTPLSNALIRRLGTRIRAHTRETSVARLPIVISELLCNELRSVLERTFDGENCSDENGPIDVYATVNRMLGNFIIELARAAYSDVIILTNIVQLIRDFGRDLSAVLVYSLRGGQSGLERVIERIASDMSRGTQERFREWILGTVVNWFYDYTRSLEPIDNSKILDYLIYGSTTQVATTSSETAHSESESVSEPMEVDNESNSRPPTHNSWIYDDEMPAATFPGHENLLPDWIPIVARDGVTQRRQLSLSDDDVTTMSDAYLATMPSKRRKLVEQRKAPLLVSPTSNRAVIPSSMERLIRESVGRAGFEEVDGAVAAIVADPTVRRAFGQAIRESLNPRRYQTPDFPDELRFPNATKFFTNPNRPTKQ